MVVKLASHTYKAGAIEADGFSNMRYDDARSSFQKNTK